MNRTRWKEKDLRLSKYFVSENEECPAREQRVAEPEEFERKPKRVKIDEVDPDGGEAMFALEAQMKAGRSY